MKFERSQSGYSLMEALVVLMIIGMIAAVTFPAMATIRSRSELRAAVGEIRSLFHSSRSRSIARDRNVALKFTLQQGTWTYSMYEDGDGDGVRNIDILQGRDPLVKRGRLLGSERAAVTIGFPSFPVTDPDSSAILSPSASPVQFNNSALCSFAPTGTATAGSIFLTNRHDDAIVVRVYGATAKIRSLRYDRVSKKWR